MVRSLGERVGREHASKLQEGRRPGGVVVATGAVLDRVVVRADQQHPPTQSGTLGDYIGRDRMDDLRPDRHPYRHGTARGLLNKMLARATVESQHRHGHQLTEATAERPGAIIVDNDRACTGLSRRQDFIAEAHLTTPADEGNTPLESPIRHVFGDDRDRPESPTRSPRPAGEYCMAWPAMLAPSGSRSSLLP